jgi:hypothetical protein
MLLGTVCIRQMANQVTVQLVNVNTPEIVKLFAFTVENCGTDDHGDMTTLAVEYVAVHDRTPKLEPSGKGCACW